MPGFHHVIFSRKCTDISRFVKFNNRAGAISAVRALPSPERSLEAEDDAEAPSP